MSGIYVTSLITNINGAGTMEDEEEEWKTGRKQARREQSENENSKG
jgi:hypothetical protein